MKIDFEKFEDLCRKYGEQKLVSGVDGITTYNEKRLHKILKEFSSDNREHYEVPVGSYVADVFDGKEIFEIQTGSLYYLRKKLEYYLDSTELPITVIKPMIAKKRIVRADAQSGEVLRVRMSPKKPDKAKLLQDIYRIAPTVKNERLRIVVLYISADEYRFSDEVRRYNKKGRYDSELYPRELISFEEYCGAKDYEHLLLGMPASFDAAEFGAHHSFCGRALYSVLNLLCSLGILERQKSGKKYIYKKLK